MNACVFAIAPIVAIVSNPAGTLFSESTNIFDYPILNDVTLTCMVDPLPPSSLSIQVSYQWNTAGCYNNSNFNNGNPRCFPYNQASQSVTDNSLTAEDAGTFNCTVNINGSEYTSESLTLHISGRLVYILQSTFITILSIGTAITGMSLNSNQTVTYVNTEDTNVDLQVIARCVTGLPSDSSNTELGGWYFNGNEVPSGECNDSVVQSDETAVVGVIDLSQCGTFSTAMEGVYTCYIVNSLMIEQSISLGLYFTGRS